MFDTSRAIVSELQGRATLAHEMVGWQYHHDRDLTGFEDGTENPSIVEADVGGTHPARCARGGWIDPAPPAVAARRDRLGGPAGRDPGGDHRAAQDGQRGAGPATPDVPRHADRPGPVGKIFRRNVAYGTVADHGTIFVGFCASQDPLARMLESMVGQGTEPPDQLTSVATAVSGAYYVVPSADRLAAFGADDRATTVSS